MNRTNAALLGPMDAGKLGPNAADVKLLSIHAIPPKFGIAPTVLIRRKGAASPKVNALIDVLLEQRDMAASPSGHRKNDGEIAA